MNSKQHNREILSKLVYARSLLYLSSMITEKENEKIQNRIRKYQDKHKIEITREQLNSIEIKFTGNEGT